MLSLSFTLAHSFVFFLPLLQMCVCGIRFKIETHESDWNANGGL